MRSLLALTVLLAAAAPAAAQTPLTGATGEPTTNTPPLAGTAVAPGPAAGPGAGGAAAPHQGRGGRAAAAQADSGAEHHGGHVRRPLAERFQDADTDHDGSLTLAEARTAKLGEVVRDFGLIDKDKKGTVTLQQIQDFRRERSAARAASERH